MAYTVPIGAICEVIFEGAMYGQQIISTYHYKLGGTVASTNGAALMDSFLGLLEAPGKLYQTYINACNENLVGLVMYGQWVIPARMSRRKRTPTLQIGQVEGPVYPVNTAAAITRRTEFAGRTERGTLHMPAVPTSFATDDAINLTGTDAYDAHGTQMIALVTTGDDDFNFKPVLWNRTNPGQAQQLDSFETRSYLRVMRRRTVGLGS